MLRSAGLALFLAAGPAACDSSSPTKPEAVDLGQEFTLAPGGIGVVRGTTFEVRFVGVADDSRCPSDVTCVWAGEVKVTVALKAGDTRSGDRDVREAETTTFAERQVTVVKVLPRPVSTRRIAADDYRVTFRVALP